MGGKRKKKETAPAAVQILEGPTNGQSAAAPPPPSSPPPSMEDIRNAAVSWATQAGLYPPFNVNGPERVDFPQHGHGYQVVIREEAGKQRMGTAKFTSEGKPDFWQVDGIVTG